MPAQKATVPFLDDGFQRGDAIFETMLVRHGRTHASEAHLERLRRSGQITGIRVPSMVAVMRDLLAAWGDSDGQLKLIVSRSGMVRGLLVPRREVRPMALTVLAVPWQTAISGAKTLSYGPNQWCTHEAQRRDADDALIVDGAGRVLELPTAAICVVRDGMFHTPDPDQLPILDSVTARTLGEIRDVKRTIVTIDEVLDADEVFVLSATRLAVPVHAIDEATWQVPGPVAADVAEALAAHVDETLDPLP
ncbi:MAG: aminotransferase class IV [Nitriliruptorales bacterium]|nr:aminotransferase class IV [Nitriliruptorales bacterium]